MSHSVLYVLSTVINQCTLSVLSVLSSIIHDPSSVNVYFLYFLPLSIIHHLRNGIYHLSTVIHHQSSIIHHLLSIISRLIYFLPLEQGWISQTSLISNYDQDNRQQHTDGNSCGGLPFGDGLKIWIQACLQSESQV